MSKVQPNHNRRIMQTGLGQPRNHSVQQTQDEALEVFGGSWKEWDGVKRSKKLATCENCFFPCVSIYVLQIHI